MNKRTYLIPGLKNWTFETSDTGYGLWSGNGGPGVAVTSSMPKAEIAERVKGILWMRFGMSDEAAEAGAKATLKVDWQAMIREAGTDVQHQTPCLPGWTLKISDLGSGLWYRNGSGVQLNTDTPVSEIAEGIRRVLQPIVPPVGIDVQANEVMQIDFKALILNAWAPRVAPLLEGCAADNTALIEAICVDVRLLVSLQNADSTALGNEICALLKQLA